MPSSCTHPRSWASFRLILASLCAAVTTFPLVAGASEGIDWYPCKQNGSLPFSCGRLTVPLDYTNLRSGKTIDLDLVKIPAAREPKMGTILTNPGGPGQDGRSFLTGAVAGPFLIATGGHYDLVSWDPRGTGRTIPYSCYTSQAKRNIANAVMGKTSDYSDTALGTVWAQKTTLADNCYENYKYGEYVGTAFVARDIMRIVDALEEDGMLRYWGFSYGTLLGATTAAMFPERIDKMVLDGVVDAQEYYAGTNIHETTKTDLVFEGFLQSCLDTPKLCPLARPGMTTNEALNVLSTLLLQLKSRPVAIGSDISTEIISYDSLIIIIFEALYTPVATWPTLAGFLNGIVTRNVTAVERYGTKLLSSSPSTFTNLGYEAEAGIQCSDSALRTDNLTSIVPLVHKLESRSRIAGGGSAVKGPLTCAQWKFKAKERYSGSFTNVQTKRPVLFVGSPNDPITPLRSAQAVSAGFGDSVVLQHDGYGHTSTAQPSLCTINAIRNYFLNGTLPEAGLKCAASIPAFTTKTVASVFTESEKDL